MKILILFFIFFILSTGSISAQNVTQKVTPTAPVQVTTIPANQLEEKVTMLEKQLKEQNANIELSSKLDIFINSMGVIATIMFGFLGISGVFLGWNVYRTRDEAERLLNSIRKMATESEKVQTKLQDVTDKTVGQADSTIKKLTEIIEQATDKTESLTASTREAQQSISAWENSKKAYISSPSIGTATFGPASLYDTLTGPDSGLLVRQDFKGDPGVVAASSLYDFNRDTEASLLDNYTSGVRIKNDDEEIK